MRKVLMVLAVLALLAVGFVWDYWQKPRPWELWERISTPKELADWKENRQQCFQSWRDAAVKVAPPITENMNKLDAEREACYAAVPRLPWKKLAAYVRKEECEREAKTYRADHPRAGHDYDCEYNEEQDR